MSTTPAPAKPPPPTLAIERALAAFVFLSGVLYATEIVESPLRRPLASVSYFVSAFVALTAAAHVLRRAGAQRNRAPASGLVGSAVLGALLFFGMGGLARALCALRPSGYPDVFWVGAVVCALVAASLAAVLALRARAARA